MLLASNSADFVNAIRRIAASDRPSAASDRPSAASDRLSAASDRPSAAGGGFPGIVAKDPTRASQCIAFAARHTWERRANSFASVIGLSQLASVQSGELLRRL
jgi:hypothetical protein